MDIKKVVVIGSGTMGSGIAAHLCNANVPVTLLDLTTEISEKARDRIHKSRPPLLLDKTQIESIASLPPLIEMQQKLIGIIQTPMQRLVIISSQPAYKIVQVMKARTEKMNQCHNAIM